jgi:beta-xylosidase
MPKLPPWVRRRDPDVWAPEVMRIGPTYVLFYSARHATLRRPDGLTLCIGAAVATSPSGPFVPQPKPLTCGGRTGVIDASPFRDGQKLWLYVKSDGNCCGEPVSISAVPLAEDGLRVTGPPSVVAGLTNDQSWEGHVVEAPQMVRHDGRYFIFFAGNDYGGERYATGYAACESATGPCRDAPENPVLTSTSVAVSGPGHQSVYTLKDKRFIAFHGWRQTDGRRYRAMYTLPLNWRDNRPEIGRPGKDVHIAPSYQ